MRLQIYTTELALLEALKCQTKIHRSLATLSERLQQQAAMGAAAAAAANSICRASSWRDLEYLPLTVREQQELALEFECCALGLARCHLNLCSRSLLTLAVVVLVCFWFLSLVTSCIVLSRFCSTFLHRILASILLAR